MTGWEEPERPWSAETRMAGLALSHLVPFPADAGALGRDLEFLSVRFPFTRHFKSSGSGWDALALVATDGDPSELRRLGRYRDTPAMRLAPAVESLLESLRCPKLRVRFIRLHPGHLVSWHCDPSDSWDLGCARLHLPVVTDPGVRSQICHEQYFFGAGELWYGDFSFPHRILHAGTSPRVHLVIELERNTFLDDLLGPLLEPQLAARRLARPLAQNGCPR